MSGIAGIFQLNGAPVEAAALPKMVTALAHLGPDGASIICAGTVGFAQLMMWTTQESLQEVLPLFDPDAGLLLTADARIDNRVELASALYLQRPLRELSDSELILAAYQRWGEDCVNHLFGAFAFVLWDASRQTLFCVTDHFKSRPLLYYQDSHRFIFASEVSGILAMPEVPKRLDERKLAASTLLPIDFREKERTYFQNIRQMPAATIMQVTAQRVDTRRYWQADPTKRLSYKDDREWLEAFRSEMIAAVDASTRSAFPVAVMLSGGLDSSSIVGIAAQRMAEQGRSLVTVSAVNADPATTHFQDERDYIAYFRGWPNLIMREVTAAGRGPLDDLAQIVHQQMTPVVDSRHFLMSALAETAAEHNARTMLFGVVGEFGPSAYGSNYLAELFVRGQWWRLAREVNLSRQRGTQTLASILRRQIVRPLLPTALTNKIRPQPNLWPTFQAVRQDFAESILGANCWRPDEALSWIPSRPDHRRTQSEMLAIAEVLDSLETFVGYERIRLWLPFFNKQLIEFCIAAPGHLKLHNGYSRYLIRAGLEGFMPPAIQWRMTKEPFSTDYPVRYNRQRAQLQEFLASIAYNDPIRELVDIPRLEKWATIEVNTNAGNSQAGYLALSVIPRSVALIHFLRLF